MGFYHIFQGCLLALWQSYDCHSPMQTTLKYASEATLRNMDKSIINESAKPW